MSVRQKYEMRAVLPLCFVSLVDATGKTADGGWKTTHFQVHILCSLNIKY